MHVFSVCTTNREGGTFHTGITNVKITRNSLIFCGFADNILGIGLVVEITDNYCPMTFDAMHGFYHDLCILTAR